MNYETVKLCGGKKGAGQSDEGEMVRKMKTTRRAFDGLLTGAH